MHQSDTPKYQENRHFVSAAAALFGGCREALGIPAVMLFASYIGFGALIRSSELSLAVGLFSTLTGWALPGQIALVELYSVGASILVISIAVALTNARLLPMAVTIMPVLRNPGTPKWAYYAAGHLVAVTTWVACMKRCPNLPTDQRVPYFFGFSCLLWVASLVGTAIGFLVPGVAPEPVTLGLVFINPIYFMLIFTTGDNNRAWILALGGGAVLGPVLHSVSPDWGLLATGLGAGTVAFGVDRFIGKGTQDG